MFGIETIGPYNVRKLSDGKYSVALNNGNIGAGIVDEKRVQELRQQYSVSSETSAASMAYGLAQVNKDVKPVSLTDYVLKLNSEGKVENKDYRIEKAKDFDNYNLYQLNKDGEAEKIIYWCNGNDKVNYSGYDEISYENGKRARSVSKDQNGIIRSVSEFYQIDEKSQDVLNDLGFRLDTKPEDFAKSLEEKNIKFQITKKGEEDNNRWISVVEKDNNGKDVKTTDWYYGTNSFDLAPIFISRSVMEEGNEVKRYILSPDELEVVSYK